jgi:hypothetical protein
MAERRIHIAVTAEKGNTRRRNNEQHGPHVADQADAKGRAQRIPESGRLYRFT